MYEEGINLKIKLTSSFFTCFTEKVLHFILFGKINLPIGNKKIDNRYFNFMSGQFLLGRRGRKSKNKNILALIWNIWIGGGMVNKVRDFCISVEDSVLIYGMC